MFWTYANCIDILDIIKICVIACVVLNLETKLYDWNLIFDDIFEYLSTNNVWNKNVDKLIVKKKKKLLQWNQIFFIQHPNGNADFEKLTSAQRTQIVWRIILKIGLDNARDARVMSLEKLLENGVFTAAYPVHDGNIKLGEGEDPNNKNDRRVSKHNVDKFNSNNIFHSG